MAIRFPAQSSTTMVSPMTRPSPSKTAETIPEREAGTSTRPIVNTDFAVFDKSGAAILGPVPINTLWSNFGGGCETNNDGDPVVKYDSIADRWVIAQPSFSTLPYLECVAVSTSGDPTGSYNRYSFSYTDFPDYPKIG